jgi:hypothetical protein
MGMQDEEERERCISVPLLTSDRAGKHENIA